MFGNGEGGEGWWDELCWAHDQVAVVEEREADVLRFQVSVGPAMGVHVRQAARQLVEYLSALHLCDATLVVKDVSQQVPSGQQLEREHQLAARAADLEQRDQVGVGRDRAHCLDLGSRHANSLDILEQRLLLDEFHRHIAAPHTLGAEDGSALARAEALLQAEAILDALDHLHVRLRHSQQPREHTRAQRAALAKQLRAQLHQLGANGNDALPWLRDSWGGEGHGRE